MMEKGNTTISQERADGAAGPGKRPRTERGRKTLRKLLDAAAIEFGERGYHEASVSSITRRAGVALGSFYTYFDSKDALFRALVGDLSHSVRDHAREAMSDEMDALEIERATLAAFLGFAREHKQIYRIIDEAEFIAPEDYRAHYETIAKSIEARLGAGIRSGDLREGLGELEAWALMGINVFIGLRYVVWSDQEAMEPDAIAARVNRMLAEGIAAAKR
jgi:AcrR family transcriptional regulator